MIKLMDIIKLKVLKRTKFKLKNRIISLKIKLFKMEKAKQQILDLNQLTSKTNRTSMKEGQ